MIFLTVGSALPFDRLVAMVDDIIPSLKLEESLLGQIGKGRYKPRNFDYVDFLTKKEFDSIFEESSAVVSHAGIGTIAKAMTFKKPILVLPRQHSFGELVDDHQLLTAKRFAALGHILAFSTPQELIVKMNELQKFIPQPRHANVQGISKMVSDFLSAS